MTGAPEPPARRVLLADLEPLKVAMQIAGVVLVRAKLDAVRLAPGVVVKVELEEKQSIEPGQAAKQLGTALSRSAAFRDAYWLTVWAQTGGGELQAEQIHALLIKVTRDVEGQTTPMERPTPTPWDVVRIAAQARLALLEDKPVTAVELATLSSVEDRTIRSYVTSGQLVPMSKRRPMRFAAEVARAELGLRDVPGFARVG